MLIKMTSKLTLAITLTIASGLWSSTSFAKDYFPLITYQCDQAKDLILVTNKLLKDGEEKSFKYSDADGTYSPWDLVEIKNNVIVDSKAITKTCKLSSGEYTVVLEPQIFNHDLTGMCGANISTAITVLSKNVALLERKAFEFHCSGNTKIITGIKVIGKTGEIKTREVPRYKYY